MLKKVRIFSMVLFFLLIIAAFVQIYGDGGPWAECGGNCEGGCRCNAENGVIITGNCCFECIHWAGNIVCCEGESYWDSCNPPQPI